MPFTTSHPAIILPLTYLPQRWFSLTALVIGSMSPDFLYFIYLREYRLVSHSILGAFWLDLPMVLLVAFIYHQLIRNTLVEHLPQALNRRITPYTHFDWLRYFKTNYLVVVTSALIGIFSHIFWDHFTHKSGYFVDIIPFFNQHVFTLLGREIFVFKILQHSSSLIGGIIVLWAIYQLPGTGQTTTKVSWWKFWVKVGMFTLTFMALQFLWRYPYLSLNVASIGEMILSMLTGILVGVLGFCWWEGRQKINKSI